MDMHHRVQTGIGPLGEHTGPSDHTMACAVHKATAKTQSPDRAHIHTVNVPVFQESETVGSGLLQQDVVDHYDDGHSFLGGKICGPFPSYLPWGIKPEQSWNIRECWGEKKLLFFVLTSGCE